MQIFIPIDDEERIRRARGQEEIVTAACVCNDAEEYIRAVRVKRIASGEEEL